MPKVRSILHEAAMPDIDDDHEAEKRILLAELRSIKKSVAITIKRRKLGSVRRILEGDGDSRVEDAILLVLNDPDGWKDPVDQGNSLVLRGLAGLARVTNRMAQIGAVIPHGYEPANIEAVSAIPARRRGRRHKRNLSAEITEAAGIVGPNPLAISRHLRDGKRTIRVERIRALMRTIEETRVAIQSHVDEAMDWAIQDRGLQRRRFQYMTALAEKEFPGASPDRFEDVMVIYARVHPGMIDRGTTVSAATFDAAVRMAGRHRGPTSVTSEFFHN